MTQETDTYQETPVESDAIPYPCSDLPLDRFVNFIRKDEEPCCSNTPNFIERLEEYFILKSIARQQEQNKKDMQKKAIRSLRTYFQNFNTAWIPSIWQTNEYGDRIRTKHSMVKDRIISKYKEQQAADYVSKIRNFSKVKNAWMNDLTKKSINEILKQSSNAVVYDPIPDVVSGIDPNVTDDQATELFNAHLTKK